MNEDYQRQYLTIPQLNDVEKVYARCPKCKEGMTIYASIQNKIGHSALGHKCEHCNEYFIIALCPYCSSLQAADAKEWDEVRKIGKFLCSNCHKESIVNVRRFNLKISPTITTAVLANWSGSESEQRLISVIQHADLKETIDDLAQVHYAVGARIASAKSELEALQKHGIQTLGVYNNQDLHDPEGEKKLDAERSAFFICNALISSLEILTQELITLLAIPCRSDRISFTRSIIENIFSEKFSNLQLVFNEFAATDDYTYLSKLRRCIHHYQSIPLCMDSTFTVDFPGPISPQAAPGTHVVFLPDNPSARLHNISFDQGRELVPTLDSITMKIEELAISAYALVSNSLTKGE